MGKTLAVCGLGNIGAMVAEAGIALGENVDGDALKALYAQGHTGKYICDFADEFMQNHPNFMCIPRLGASTEEAEDNCAAMAADQIIKFLETGTIKNAVNFPAANLDRQDSSSTRLCIINENKPGVLGNMTSLISSKGYNIAQQLNTSKDSIAYNVVDLDDFPQDAGEALQKELIEIEGILSTRIIWTGSVNEGPGNFITKSS